jgi:hypothetical protein
MATTATTTASPHLLYVQHGGFRNYAGAWEFASLIHNVLFTYKVETFREDGGGGSGTSEQEKEQQQQQQRQPQRQDYSLYVIRDNPAGCFMCAASAQSPSFHVTMLLKCAAVDAYFPTIHYRLSDAAVNAGICTSAKQCCGYVVRPIPDIVYRSMREAWRESRIVPCANAYGFSHDTEYIF